jgi:hypothetical protein
MSLITIRISDENAWAARSKSFCFVPEGTRQTDWKTERFINATDRLEDRAFH